MAKSGLATIVLPIGVADKRSSRVEGEVCRHARKALRVQRQIGLQTQHRIKDQKSGQREGEHGTRVAKRALLPFGVNAADAVESALETAHHRRQDCPFATENPGHIKAQRLDREEYGKEKQADLQPSVKGHGSAPDQKRSGRSSVTTR